MPQIREQIAMVHLPPSKTLKYLFHVRKTKQVVEIRLVFLLLIHFKTAVAELHQIFDLVVAELVPQTESASFRC